MNRAFLGVYLLSRKLLRKDLRGNCLVRKCLQMTDSQLLYGKIYSQAVKIGFYLCRPI